jgi:hypothetical protein
MRMMVVERGVVAMDRKEVFAAVAAAFAAPVGAPVRTCGCGRAYVCVSADRATVNAVAAACRKLGKLFVRKNYGAGGNAIYCGYDNADGVAWARAEAVAASLKAAGVACYTDGASD